VSRTLSSTKSCAHNLFFVDVYENVLTKIYNGYPLRMDIAPTHRVVGILTICQFVQRSRGLGDGAMTNYRLNDLALYSTGSLDFL
jgi:hypothetical protein